MAERNSEKGPFRTPTLDTSNEAVTAGGLTLAIQQELPLGKNTETKYPFNKNKEQETTPEKVDCSSCGKRYGGRKAMCPVCRQDNPYYPPPLKR